MKKLGAVLLGLTAALPLYAQDDTAPATSPEEVPAGGAPDEATPPADQSAAPADQSATPPPDTSSAPSEEATPPTDASVVPAESTPSDTTTTDTTATDTTATDTTATDTTATDTTATDTSSTETPPVEETVDATATESAPAEAAPEENSNPWVFYVGGSYGTAKVSISNVEGFASTDTTTRMAQGRVGVRLTDGLGIEGHFGKGFEDDNTPNQTMLDTYYGIYFVPTGILLDAVEFAFPLGFAWTKIKDGNSEITLDGISYGMNVEFPIKLIDETVPDIRIVGGGMMYQQNNSARSYGWHAGLRWDFAI